MDIPLAIGKGAVLDVPILLDSPVNFELEVSKRIPLAQDSDVYLCKIRNVLADEELKNPGNLEETLRKIAPVSTTCTTYFSWEGKSLGAWGAPKERLNQKK